MLWNTRFAKSRYKLGIRHFLFNYTHTNYGDDYMIPIKIETLLEGRKVEQNRIEYKEGFNPSEIVHTICGYANDIAGVDGGYLVIGVKTENGLPILPPMGVSEIGRAHV